MKSKMKSKILPLYGLLMASAFGTPTGLNNIPTADTVPDRVVAVQAFSSFGGANQFGANGPGKHSFWMGFKTGIEFAPLRVEWGLDSPIGQQRSGPLYSQIKAGITPWKNGSLALGVAGIALTDVGRAGNPFTYAMLAHDFGVLRAHTGYGLQTHGNTVLFGVDRTWKILDRDLNLNADLVQTRDGKGWLPAIGAKYVLNPHIVLESWTNFPDRGSASFIGKINFVFKF